MPHTILITGASSGFGAACARRFAAGGWKVILTGRREERLRKLQEELGDAVLSVLVFDVRKRSAVHAALQALPPVDVLLNNAGLALGLAPAWKAEMEDWETMVDTNIKGVLYATQELLPRMVERNQGHIVNIGSTAGSWPYPGGNVYGATKAFLQQFSRNLRADLLGTRVRVTHLDPGMAESEFSKIRFKGDEKLAGQVYEGTDPLKPEDIAEIVFFVANLPPHVNVNALEVMSVNQSWGPLAVHRKPLPPPEQG